MGKHKKAPYTKRALQATINKRDQQIRDMKKAGIINQTFHFKAKLKLKSEIRELKRIIKGYEDGK